MSNLDRVEGPAPPQNNNRWRGKRTFMVCSFMTVSAALLAWLNDWGAAELAIAWGVAAGMWVGNKVAGKRETQ